MTDAAVAENVDSAGWMAMHNLSQGGYENIPGLRYRFPRSIPNGTAGLQVGDTVVCFRAQKDTPEGEGRIFGIGRIGHRIDTGDGERDEVYYDRYLAIYPPLNWETLGGDPRNNKTNSIVQAPASFIKLLLQQLGLEGIHQAPATEVIEEIPDEQFEAVIAAAEVSEVIDEVGSELAPLHELTLELVEKAAKERGLSFQGTGVLAQAVHAICSGKHLLLQGAPGTGKTSLAEAIAAAAAAIGVCRGVLQITGSSDWTPSDTVGTYRMNREKDLEFVPGYLLQSIRSEKWVVLDELNRSDIDRAMGPFFTVLSGKATTLRYEELVEDGNHMKVAVVPSGGSLDGHVNYEVHDNWRILATMNTKDLDLLFEVSQAFLRRFAIVTVPCPSLSAHLDLLAPYATGLADVDEMVGRLCTLPSIELGPAITIDCARYAEARSETKPAPKMPLLADEIFDMFVAPQLGGYDEIGRRTARRYLRTGSSDHGDDDLGILDGPEEADLEPETDEG